MRSGPHFPACLVLLYTSVGAAPAFAGRENPSPKEPQTRAAAAAPEGETSPYVLGSGRMWDGAPSWLFLGWEQRLRFEDRTGRLREDPKANEIDLGLSRTRLSFGLAPAKVPIRFLLEAQDARQFATAFPMTPAAVDELDILQLRLDVDLERWLRAPIRVDVGRSSFDAIDRRLLARNRFRNTTNAFEGARVSFGGNGRPVGGEVLALVPVERRIESADRRYDGRKLLGVTAKAALPGAGAAIEPYYLFFESTATAALRQSLHTFGLHVFGAFDGGRFDHDVDVAFQGGRDGERAHRAFALHAEIGRTFHVKSAPRLAAWINYATGDKHPDDRRNERFDPLFGASHTMYGFTDLFAWQNLMSPTVALSFRPESPLRAEVFYRLYWLASATDAWVRAALVDPTGRSGSFIGQGLDLSLRYRVIRFVEIELQYGELFAGGFVDRTGGGRGARVFFGSVVVGTGGSGS